ncbi:MAG: hypothetical protein VB977_11970 [Pseudohongiellaceae bacterium]|jgi:hypothetical protein|tara:strand:- start:41068 stop:41205 length:138 start_codon:yes stop_codon:yes gene_type:complete
MEIKVFDEDEGLEAEIWLAAQTGEFPREPLTTVFLEYSPDKQSSD